MPPENRPFDRRDFLRQAGALSATLSTAFAKSSSRSSGRVLGANDRINIGIIGCGDRGYGVSTVWAKIGKENNSCQVVAVADCYQRRVNKAKDYHHCDGYLDYREVIARGDVDAVYIATADHWHAKVALDAMDKGKDVYLEKPMCHTLEEVRQLVATVRETGRVLQVGSQTTSADQWWKAKKAIADGMVGKMIMSQGSYHRNSVIGEWNYYKIDNDAGPDKTGEQFVDWKTWLGPAPKRAWDPDRFFRFRKYWDYSGGIATDLFFHVVAPLNICWDKPQYPHKVMASGGIYGGPAFEEKREVPDTFHLLAEYREGHSLVLSSSMANSQHIPGLIRGHEGTIIMVEHGRFEGATPYITVKPEVKGIKGEDGKMTFKPLYDTYKFGIDEQKIPVDQYDPLIAHMNNFLDCMRTRKKPHLDVETGACAQVLITAAVESYRQGKVLYFDEKKWKFVDKPVKA
jgi:predicted dehydrogenase